MISVVIRTRNEEEWISRCLAAVSRQDYHDFEIVVVDNESSDRTLELVSEFDCKVVHIDQNSFSYGRAINEGIRASSGDLVAILSGHCVPLNQAWLSMLRAAFDHPLVAGVYGRQEPLPDTDPFDKRDLWTTFGIERRVQLRDFFFHNANSMIRRSVWETIPFDEVIAGVEDRDWAKRVVQRGYRVVYEPAASVYHYHGIHQGGNRERAERVARVIEVLNYQ